MLRRHQNDSASDGLLACACACALALCLVELGAGCASPPSGALPPPPESVPYRIGPSDELTIRVLPEPTIEREVVVQPDGSFVFDLIGEVKASGRTPEDVGQEIEKRIAEYRQNPSASVTLDRAASASVTVLGEVETRGMYPVERILHVTDAIARAGGPTELAAASRVRLIRREGNQSTTYLANLDRIHEGDLATDYLVVAGDMIYVPPSSTVSFGYALGRALYPLEVLVRIFLAPFIGLVAADN